jgi:putative type II/III system pilus formation protein
LKFIRHISFAIALLGTLPCGRDFAAAQVQSADANGVPSLVEVYWQGSRTIALPALTDIAVLDPDIARVQVVNDGLQVFGLARGETVVLGFLHEKPVSIRVRVIPRPIVSIPPSLLRRQGEMAQGSFGSTAQIANGGRRTTTAVVNDFTWAQPAGTEGRLFINTQVEDNDLAGGHAFNIRHGSIAYRSPHLDVSLLDNLVSLTNNGAQRYLTPLTYSDNVELRGATVALRQGDNQYLFFGGATVPSYFLTLGSSRDIGGFSFARRQSQKLNLFATTSYINSPVDFFNPADARMTGCRPAALLISPATTGACKEPAAPAHMAASVAAN